MPFHHFLPNPVLIKIGNFNIYWYGFLIFIAFWSGFLISLKLAKKFRIKKEKIFDLAFWLFIFGLIGARFYHVFSEFKYYWQNPLEILFFWQGGLGIYGAMIFCFFVLYFYSKKNKLNFFSLLDLFSPSLALGLGIARWGNYFNQEIYGLPTNSFFRIPISLENRLPGFENFEFFHPLFFYESIFCLFVFLFLILRIKKGQPGSIFFLFVILYSTFRFFIEFLRIDPQPIIFGLRLGQISSLFAFLFAILIKFSMIKKNGDDGTRTRNLIRDRDAI